MRSFGEFTHILLYFSKKVKEFVIYPKSSVTSWSPSQYDQLVSSNSQKFFVESSFDDEDMQAIVIQIGASIEELLPTYKYVCQLKKRKNIPVEVVLQHVARRHDGRRQHFPPIDVSLLLFHLYWNNLIDHQWRMQDSLYSTETSYCS
jgi:hypothetical protein